MRSANPEGFPSIPSATGGIARLACARMREAGKGTAAVLSGAGLRAEQVDDPTVRLEVRTQIKVLELAAQELQDDFLGFHLARSFDLREIGLLYYVMASSGLLADALRNAERYSSICRQLTDNRLAPRRLTVRHFRDYSPAEYKLFLASDVEFGAEADEIVFSEQVASLPIVGADTYLNKLLRRYADEALAHQPHERGSVRVDVERAIPQLLPHGKAKTSDVARQLGLSSRALSRSLSAEGTSFGQDTGGI